MRLWNSELLETVAECSGEFSPPQTAMTGATGLYCGEQDLFCFLIDPAGWIEIGEEAFAPGFFCWNSEVGRRVLAKSAELPSFVREWHSENLADTIPAPLTDSGNWERGGGRISGF